MGQVRDESLIFSLHTLQELERERVEREQAQQLARQQAQRLSLQEEERLHREAEARRARAEIARRHEETLRRKEEEARLSAMREALVERARVEADWKGRLEREGQERAHAERMATLEVQSLRRRVRVCLGVAAVVGVCAIACIFFLKTRLEETRRLFADQAETLALERESRQRLDRLLELSERRVAVMTAQVEEGTQSRASADDERPTSADTVVVPDSASDPERGTPGAKDAHGTSKNRRGNGQPGSPKSILLAPSPEEHSERCAGDGDPLNGCLPRGLRSQ